MVGAQGTGDVEDRAKRPLVNFFNDNLLVVWGGRPFLFGSGGVFLSVILQIL